MLLRTVVAVLSLCAIAEGANPAGLLSMVSGNVQIVRAGEKASQPARTADLIGPGDRLVTGPGANATFLFCPESRTAKLLADGEVDFSASALQVRKGKLSDERKLPSCLLPGSLALAGASKLQTGALRLRGSDLLLISPARTNIVTLQPHFRWEKEEDATVYDLKVTDREEHVLWTESSPSTEAEYPSTASPLAWGQKYNWRVTARNGDDLITEVGSYFQVLPEDTSATVRAGADNFRRMVQENPSDTGPLFLLAFVYDENGMLDEAARVYGSLAQKIGPQDWIQSRLTDLMNKLSWPKLDSAPAR